MSPYHIIQQTIYHVYYVDDALQGPVLLEKVGGLHSFMKWKHALLTVRRCTCMYFPCKYSLVVNIVVVEYFENWNFCTVEYVYN